MTDEDDWPSQGPCELPVRTKLLNQGLCQSLYVLRGTIRKERKSGGIIPVCYHSPDQDVDGEESLKPIGARPGIYPCFCGILVDIVYGNDAVIFRPMFPMTTTERAGNLLNEIELELHPVLASSCVVQTSDARRHALVAAGILAFAPHF